ncbi:FAD-dependent oxidoreductase [Streptomyces sp. CoH27]|uniref:NAD(P)/FAD-dependent oxidoreductase n=1 Tax=Streptomyces sp. CoH27 TaxID=2875763 RepID=UPI001CD57A6D|nr:FAD-dependent oxidoreductase [Streptomyces sp. CoH27]
MSGTGGTGHDVPDPSSRRADVLVVGAGPAGLVAAARLASSGAGRVEVLEREQEAGGVPRHCAHGGFGSRSRPRTGPEYAHLLAEAAARAGAVIRTGVTVLDWGASSGAMASPGLPGARVAEAGRGTPDQGGASAAVPSGVGRRVPEGVAGAGAVGGGLGRHAVGPERGPVLRVVGPGGHETIAARAVVLATGARERPCTARLVPGTRPAGVCTTGELQQAVHLFGQHIGARAVVVGAENVSYAAADTVRAAGAEVVALVTEQPRAQVPLYRAQSVRLGRGIALLTETTVTEILGHGRLSGVRVRHRDGRTTVLACDTVVFTGDFIPDHELARRGALVLDAGTRGPAVNGSLHTSRYGVFAAGNVLHAVEPAATAAREGARAAGAVLDFLGTGTGTGAGWPGPGLPLTVEAPLRWIAPNRVSPAARPEQYVLRTEVPLHRPALYVRQDGRLLHHERRVPGTVLPHRTLTLGAGWHHRVDPEGGQVRVSAEA